MVKKPLPERQPRHYWERFRRQLSHPYRTLNQIELSRSALLHNYDLVSDQHPGKAIMPVLKANAYGHGLAEVAEILQARRSPYLIVDGYFEALRLRQLTKQPLLIMGYIDPVNFPAMKTNGFAFVVHDRPTLETLGRLRRSVTIHLEINTGMNRHGIEPEELESYLNLIKGYPNLNLEGVMSHLADADGETDEYTQAQVETFDNCVDVVLNHNFNPKLVHLAQTAGSVRTKSRHANALRLGIGLYGINPFADTPQAKNLKELKPVLRLTSTITKVIKLKAGEKVSYNGLWTAPAATRLGVLPLGYYEGLPRSLSNSGEVKVGSEYFPIRGRVCMNHIMVELGEADVEYLDQVTVISRNPRDRNSVASLQRDHDLFSYELLTGLSNSVRRVIAD